MSQSFKIYIDRIDDQEVLQIKESVSSAFLEIKEQDLSFPSEITFYGSAYKAEDYLILELNITTEASIPCIICNTETLVSIAIHHFTHTVELSEIPSGIYDFSEELRHHILLKIPGFIECNGGKCPERIFVNKYLNSSKEPPPSPFSELSL